MHIWQLTPMLIGLVFKRIIEEELGLTQNLYTTQIEPHDYMAEIFLMQLVDLIQF